MPPRGKLVLRAQASPVFDVGGNVALSPSGRRAAIIMAEGLQIFDLPAASAAAVRLGAAIQTLRKRARRDAKRRDPM